MLFQFIFVSKLIKDIFFIQVILFAKVEVFIHKIRKNNILTLLIFLEKFVSLNINFPKITHQNIAHILLKAVIIVAGQNKYEIHISKDQIQ